MTGWYFSTFDNRAIGIVREPDQPCINIIVFSEGIYSSSIRNNEGFIVID